MVFWQKGVDLKDHPMINKYLQNLQKTITRSRTKALVSNLTVPSEGNKGTVSTINNHNFRIPSDKPQVNLISRSHEVVQTQASTNLRIKRAHKLLILQLLILFLT